MMMIQMGSSSLDQENKIRNMGHEHDDHDDDSFESDVSSVVSSDDESDDEFDQSNSSSSNTALGNMSGLLQQLPSKRGLSKHFQGKSQSFTSLSKVTCLEDLAKPENPYNKKMKSCKSYVALSTVVPPPPAKSASSSKLNFTKTLSSRASCSSLSNSSRPPAHPSHNNGATTASGFSNQTPLFV